MSSTNAPTGSGSRRQHRAAAEAASRRVRAAARRKRLVAFVLAPVLALGTVGLGVWGATSATAAALPAPAATISLQDGATQPDADAKPFILAGEDATFDVSLKNTSPTGNGYNIGFTLLVPNGIGFVSTGGLGAPVIFASGATLPNSATAPVFRSVPNGFQLWVFEDVSDLPATATYGSTITVRPDAAVFPVGASPEFDLTGYISSAPQLKPIFDGSTGRGGTAALAETSSDDAESTAPVHALRLTKAEPSPEIELLRGVHDHQTTYTLTVENTPQGTTNGVTVVDYLPAGLEFLGCADVDNTQPSSLLSGGDREYPGSGPVTGTAPADCLEPVSVETVNTGIPAGLPAGVYTKVTWELPPLSGQTAQAYPAAAGTPGITKIQYKAAVPLFENTMDFVTDAGGPDPSPASLEQGSNLNNNNGPSTRQGQNPTEYDDGILYTNSATVAGTYAGPLATGASAAASDTDTEQIQAMDLRILKSVDTGNNGNEFDTGQLATFTLDIATSEYASAGNIVVTDTLPNGLCPAVAGLVTLDPVPQECQDASTGTVTGATLLAGSTYDPQTGVFVMRLALSDLTADDTHQVTYPVLMRSSYDTDAPYSGPTSSGDSLVNEVEIEGETTPIADIAGVVNAAGAPAGTPETVWDDSSAEIVSDYSQISKKVLPRDLVVDTAPDAPTAAETCDVTPTGGWQQNQTDQGDTAFHLGDVVCYELTVDYAQQIDVRNPVVTDFLPGGVEYVDSAVYDGPGGTTPGMDVVEQTPQGSRLQWLVGTPDASGDRIVALGSKLVIHVLARITSMTPNNDPTQDKPENLMKYQQENVLGELFFLRDASAIKTAQGPTLVKGVRSVDGGPENGFDSDVDGVPVRGGDEVSFRVDLTGGSLPVSDMVVWDSLPTGIVAADVSAVSDGGVAVDPGQPGYPASIEDPTRAVVIWNDVPDLAPVPDAGSTYSLTYTVTVPVDIEVNRTLVNTAAITQFDVTLNTGSTETFFPEGSLDPTTPPASHAIPGTDSRDDSNVVTPNVSVAKSLVGTEVGPVVPPAAANLDPNNAANQAVAGELITWRYSVTVPAETTVTDAVLFDTGVLAPGSRAFTVDPARSSASGPGGGTLPTGFTFDAAGTTGRVGVLTFPASYANATTTDQVFTVTLVGSIDAGQSIANNTTLANTARFTSATSGTIDRTADVVYIAPNPTITKSANPRGDVSIGQPIQYSVAVSNSAGRPISYDNTIVDQVPAGLIVAPLSISNGGVLAGTASDGSGGTITWQLAAVRPAATLTYTASIVPGSGGGTTYENTVGITGYTLPDDVAGDDTTPRRGELIRSDTETVEAVTADLAKGVRIDPTTPYGPTASAPIGDRAEYQVVVDLAENINYYDVRVVDTLPAGVVADPTTLSAPVVTPGGSVPGTWNAVYDATARTITWTLTGTGDIAYAAQPRTLTFTYAADLTDAVPQNVNALDNTAAFSWNRVNDDPTTRDDVDDTARVDVLNPVLAIDKTVSNAKPNPGDTFTYTVRVTNTGNTPAYNMAIDDVVPAGVIVDETTITGGGTLAGDTITWTPAGPLNQSGGASPTELVFTYDATLAASSTLSDATGLVNTASVTAFASFPTGGREYTPTDVDDTATVTPAFPNVVLQKAVSSPLAYVDEPLTWTLTLRNTGDGPAQTLSATDILPPNWQYVAGTAQISRGGAASVALTDPTIAAATTGDTLVWSTTQVSPAAPALSAASVSPTDPTRAIVITFQAEPTGDALDDPGIDTPHTNRLQATTTDTSGATGNASGSYTGPEATASTEIDLADLSLVKTAAGTPLVAGGAAATAWTLTVTNDGPDTAVGPFTVTDVPTLPAGFTVTGARGTGWSCTVPDASGFTCERTNPADTLAAGASFADIVVSARVSASFAPADAPVPNTATVEGKTYDDDPTDNTDSDVVDVSFNADLRLVKSGPSTTPNAGESLTWILTVDNLGPADSRSVTGDLITVTDEIPAGVEDVTVGTLPTGWTSDATGPLQPGDTVTFTLAAGTSIPTGGVAAFTLTGTIDPSLVPGTEIENTAEVTPGATTDPNPTNNTGEVTVEPDTETAIGVAKTRVVEVAGTWVPAASLSPVPPVTPGDPVTYLVTVANTGPADARAVVVTDEVEDYLSYGSLTSVEGTWTRTSTTNAPGDDQTFALADPLAAGASASFRATFTVNAGHTGDVENTVLADAENAPEDSATDDSSSTRSANLAIVKSHTGDATAGRSLEYTLTVTNEGPSDSSGPITIADTLPAGFGYAAGTATVSVDGGAATPLAPTVAGQVLTWTPVDASGVLPVGAEIVVVFEATVDAAVEDGTYDNVATVDAPDDTDPSDDSWTDPTKAVTSADLSITKVADAGPHIAGTPVVYTLTVENAGPSVARTVSVTDVIPAGLTVTAISGTDWDCTVATALCTRDELPLGTSTITVTADIAAAVLDGSVLANTATVASGTSDPDPDNNSDTEEITVDAQADLAIVKTAVDADGAEITEAVAGTQVRYRFEVDNLGPSDAVGPIQIADQLPAGFSFVSIADGASAWECLSDPADTTVFACETATGLAAGASTTDLVIIAAIDPSLAAGPATNTAVVGSQTEDPNPANDTDTAVVDVVQDANLAIVKTHDAGAVRIGDALAFDLAVTNLGPSTATAVTVVDTIPAGLEYTGTGATDAAWTVVADPVAADGTTTVTATLAGALAPGASAPVLQVAVTVLAGSYPEVTNTAVVAADQPDSDPSDNTSEDVVDVPALASLTMQKTAVGAFQAGSNATYTITVANAGPTEDPGPIVIADELPSSMRFVSANGTGSECAAASRTVTCTVSGPLAAGASTTVTLVVALQRGAYPEVVNTATVASPTAQTATASLASTATTPVAADPLAATGADPVTAVAGLALLLVLLGVLLLVARRFRRVEA